MPGMKAVVCHRTELTVADVPDPRPARGQLLLKVLRCGICGSDLHARHHADELQSAAAATGYAEAMGPDDTVVMGHEFVGEVIDSRKGFSSGDRVVALPIRRADGRVHPTGLSRFAPGAYAEQVVVEASLAMKVPDELSTDHAALTEPMAVALHAVRRGEVGAKQVAVVIGCGPIGLGVISMLKATGVRTVVASDLSAERRRLARACGADVVVDPRTDDPWTAYDTSGYVTEAAQMFDLALGSMEKLRMVPFVPWWHVMHAAEIAGAMPEGPVVFECVGVPGVIDEIIAKAPLASRVVVVGVTMAPDTIRPAIAINKEIDLRFVIAYTPREFRDALHLLAEGKVNADALITGRVGLKGVDAAFGLLGDAGKHAKILVAPSHPGVEVHPA
jgi:threonine dehydrogenase-like Zn-dependent dehydrogenase